MPSVCIVGSNRGIGLELVKHYSNRGDTVYALCRKTSEDLNKLKNVIVLGKGHRNKIISSSDHVQKRLFVIESNPY